MTDSAKVVLAVIVLGLIGVLGVAIAVPAEKTTVTVTLPSKPETGCACGATAVPVKKYLIFWKDKDGYRASPTLFLTIEMASAAIPRDAEEARIVPVRID